MLGSMIFLFAFFRLHWIGQATYQQSFGFIIFVGVVGACLAIGPRLGRLVSKITIMVAELPATCRSRRPHLAQINARLFARLGFARFAIPKASICGIVIV